MEKWRTT